MNTILVPTDYSKNANHALKAALYLAKKSNSQLVIFHWVEILIPTSTPSHLYKDLYNQQLKGKQTELQSQVVKAFAELNLPIEEHKINYVIKDGSNIQDTVLDAIKDNNIDLVVMGTHGASGLKKFFFGSNTSKIIEKSAVPVLAIPADYPIGDILKIGYASDLKDVASEVSSLVKFAQLTQASIEIFHVYPTFPEVVDISQPKLDELHRKLTTAYPEQKFLIHIVQTYKENDIINGIQKFVESYKPDVLAMFTVKRTFLDKLFDASKTETIAFDTNIPLLTFRKTL